MKKLIGVLVLLLLSVHIAAAQARADRERDGLKGKVKSVRVEMSQTARRDGRDVEDVRKLMEVRNYDEQGNRTEELRYSFVKGSLEERTVFSRDAAGNQLRVTYGPNGIMTSRAVDSFDRMGHPTESITYDPNGAVIRRGVSRYDANGRPIEGLMYNGDGSLSNKTIYLYDPQGKYLGFELRNASGNIMMKVTQNADSYEVARYDNEGAVEYRSTAQAPAYEYDSQGNWIKQTTRSSQTRAGITEEVIQVQYRTITYY